MSKHVIKKKEEKTEHKHQTRVSIIPRKMLEFWQASVCARTDAGRPLKKLKSDPILQSAAPVHPY